MTVLSRYTLKEVAQHDGTDEASTWTIIHDLIYDVTNYKAKHPGGAELIDEYAGRDATIGFDDFGHSSDAKRMLKDFLIGELVDEDKMANKKKKNTSFNKTRRKTFLSVLCGSCTREDH
ncbi:cytochrome b5-like isoform X2 [Colletes gigas]|uniref:cytochrome b5-like isoform X2 n=1 Tax=Colletes gigas TaxID=935657 RepID=UPI001C9B4C53|nr:cytochrome b5-like isoform X2 [Colletes gigas]